jgi:hypothetical protein
MLMRLWGMPFGLNRTRTIREALNPGVRLLR